MCVSKVYHVTQRFIGKSGFIDSWINNDAPALPPCVPEAQTAFRHEFKNPEFDQDSFTWSNSMGNRKK